MAKKREGRLDIITGPMFSGKSEELVKRLRRFKIAGLCVKVFNHAIDTRYSRNKIASHSKDQWKAIAVSDPRQILEKISQRTKVVVIDEAQFFEESLVPVTQKLLENDIIVIAAGLDTNFRGEPFGVMPQLLALADGEVLKLKAVCSICRKWNATRTQRLYADGTPAAYTDPLVKVGALDSYQARCRAHHEVPGKS
jgi:thymidine kinase